jgi:hypothetical protein
MARPEQLSCLFSKSCATGCNWAKGRFGQCLVSQTRARPSVILVMRASRSSGCVQSSLAPLLGRLRSSFANCSRVGVSMPLSFGQTHQTIFVALSAIVLHWPPVSSRLRRSCSPSAASFQPAPEAPTGTPPDSVSTSISRLVRGDGRMIRHAFTQLDLHSLRAIRFHAPNRFLQKAHHQQRKQNPAYKTSRPTSPAQKSSQIASAYSSNFFSSGL